MTAQTDSAVVAWTAALTELARGLDDIERALLDDDWRDPPTVRVVAPDVAIPPQLVPRAEQLMARLDDLQARLSGELRATGVALGQLDLRRSAARNYRKSATTASVTDRGDD